MWSQAVPGEEKVDEFSLQKLMAFFKKDADESHTVIAEKLNFERSIIPLIEQKTDDIPLFNALKNHTRRLVRRKDLEEALAQLGGCFVLLGSQIRDDFYLPLEVFFHEIDRRKNDIPDEELPYVTELVYLALYKTKLQMLEVAKLPEKSEKANIIASMKQFDSKNDVRAQKILSDHVPSLKQGATKDMLWGAAYALFGLAVMAVSIYSLCVSFGLVEPLFGLAMYISLAITGAGMKVVKDMKPEDKKVTALTASGFTSCVLGGSSSQLATALGLNAAAGATAGMGLATGGYGLGLICGATLFAKGIRDMRKAWATRNDYTKLPDLFKQSTNSVRN